MPQAEGHGGPSLGDWVSASVLTRKTWTLAFTGYLAYVFVVLTFRVPVGQLGVLAGLAGLAVMRQKLTKAAFLWWAFALTAWGALSATWSPFPSVVLDQMENPIKLLLVAFLGVNAVRSRAQYETFAAYVVFWFLVYPTRGTILNYLSGNTRLGRAAWNGEFANPNVLAAAALVPLSLALTIILTSSVRGLRVLMGIAVAGFVTVILLTQSRAGVLALCLLITLVIAASRQRARALFRAAVLVIVVLALAPSSIWLRVLGLGAVVSGDVAAADPEGSAQGRMRIAQTAIRIIADHPLMGTGRGTYPLMNARYNPSSGAYDSHNTYLHVTSELGIVGLVLFLGMVWQLIRSTRATLRAVRVSMPAYAASLRVLLAGFVAFLCSGIWGSYDTYSLFFVMMAALYSYARLPYAGPSVPYLRATRDRSLRST